MDYARKKSQFLQQQRAAIVVISIDGMVAVSENLWCGWSTSEILAEIMPGGQFSTYLQHVIACNWHLC